MAELTDQETADLLQSALSSAFSPAPLPRRSAQPSPPAEPAPAPEAPTPAEPAPATETTTETVVTQDAYDAWKVEYEAQVAEWRKVNIANRERAEKERAKWEAIRAQERAEGKDPEKFEWETVGSTSSQARDTASPSPADARDLVSGEKPGHHTKEYVESALPGPSSAAQSHSQAQSHGIKDPLSASQKWEDFPSSLHSSESYPSMSFPSGTNSNPDTPPESNRHQQSHHHHHLRGREEKSKAPAQTQSVTLAVFDNSLPVRTRALAALSALAINLALPFVNGVMLGFGEIFAKEVIVGWFGWNKGTNIGLGRRKRDERR